MLLKSDIEKLIGILSQASQTGLPVTPVVNRPYIKKDASEAVRMLYGVLHMDSELAELGFKVERNLVKL